MKFFNVLLLISMLGFINACGSDSDDDESAQNETQQQDDQGTYQAILNPLNVTAAGTPSATTTIRIRGDEVDARNIAKDTPRNIIHRQHIWTGGSCPTPANDTNQDGFVDYNEAKAAIGSIIVPLDNELSGQIPGGVYPVANSSGNYSYHEKTSLARLLADLLSPDPVPEDDFVKLDPQDSLNLSGKTVLIHGVSSTFPLPASVSSTANAPAHRTLPIACGVLVRVADSEEPDPTPVPPTPPTPPTPIPACPVETEFETRLNNQLLIGGVRCRGGETTEVLNEDGSSDIYTCRRGQWLVTVDNINTCTDEGLCTEIFVFPVITTLSRAGNSNPPAQCTFNFQPRSPASPSQRSIMNAHQVRFSRDTEPVVIRKN